MLPIVELLRFEESLYLVRNGIVRIVSEVWRDLVGAREYGGARPPRNVQHFLIGCLLCHLDRINDTH